MPVMAVSRTALEMGMTERDSGGMKKRQTRQTHGRTHMHTHTHTHTETADWVLMEKQHKEAGLANLSRNSLCRRAVFKP